MFVDCDVGIYDARFWVEFHFSGDVQMVGIQY